MSYSQSRNTPYAPFPTRSIGAGSPGRTPYPKASPLGSPQFIPSQSPVSSISQVKSAQFQLPSSLMSAPTGSALPSQMVASSTPSASPSITPLTTSVPPTLIASPQPMQMISPVRAPSPIASTPSSATVLTPIAPTTPRAPSPAAPLALASATPLAPSPIVPSTSTTMSQRAPSPMVGTPIAATPQYIAGTPRSPSPVVSPLIAPSPTTPIVAMTPPMAATPRAPSPVSPPAMMTLPSSLQAIGVSPPISIASQSATQTTSAIASMSPASQATTPTISPSTSASVPIVSPTIMKESPMEGIVLPEKIATEITLDRYLDNLGIVPTSTIQLASGKTYMVGTTLSGISMLIDIDSSRKSYAPKSVTSLSRQPSLQSVPARVSGYMNTASGSVHGIAAVCEDGVCIGRLTPSGNQYSLHTRSDEITLADIQRDGSYVPIVRLSELESSPVSTLSQVEEVIKKISFESIKYTLDEVHKVSLEVDKIDKVVGKIEDCLHAETREQLDIQSKLITYYIQYMRVREDSLLEQKETTARTAEQGMIKMAHNLERRRRIEAQIMSAGEKMASFLKDFNELHVAMKSIYLQLEGIVETVKTEQSRR